MTTHTVEEFVTENPEWADLPDSAIEDTFTYRSWLFSQALSDLGHSILEELRRVPLIGRWIR